MDKRKRLGRSFFSITVLAIGLLCSALYQAVHVFDDKSRVIRKIPTTHKVVAITIDDGPHYKTTPEILRVLKEKQVKATFFVLGANAEAHPEIVAQAVADGHEIASHAYSHRRLNRLTAAEVAEEFARLETVLQPVAPKPTLFRPPDGAYNDGIVALARDRGYTTVLWSVDTGDWRQGPVDLVVKAVLEHVQPGSIILMHDGQYPLPTPQAMPIIIDKLQALGYQLVTVSELLQYYEVAR
ncbi:polysaccharide deacetylase family protein [Sporomusa termitida]|uniref:Peptidoglycan-N-acetylglucosamine deacetylase n=1 Tax=Sporomusa termitida TaxID=2377 RepID=A0A517E130_9FIRM|nr:polysaccharide deacetylase family protein [Sporomusa termitida]QDR83206.1 Peptidoglycan-N-acetylglucosamine deacetylase [Sporomusa termitida]